MDLTWSPQSVRDLEAMRRYIAVDSPVYADAMVRRVIAAVERLLVFPDSGREVPELNDAAIRELIVGAYRVVYRRRRGAVEVATVFRGSRLLPDLASG